MKSRLRLNNTPIWHLIDLQKAFSPLELYEQLPEFLQFATVHCKILESKLKNENGTYKAVYITKEFWLDILNCKQWPKEHSASCLQFFLTSLLEKENEGIAQEDKRQEIKKAVEAEAYDAQLEKKLNHICTDGKLLASSPKAIMLLAICEIAEVDARAYHFVPADGSKVVSYGQKQPVLFPQQDEVVYAPNTNYCFYYHDEETLAADARIRTVTIKAKPSTKGNQNKYNQLVIELYSQKENRCVQTVNLKPGTFRRCNVANGRIIKFLPDIGVERGCFLYRKELSSSELTVKAENRTEKLSLDGLTTFAPLSAQDGCLLVCDGRINTAKCNVALDWTKTMKLQTSLKVVELAWAGRSLCALTETGNVYTLMRYAHGVCQWEPVVIKQPNMTNCASLTAMTRAPGLSIASKDALQAALSSDGTQLAVLMRDGRCELRQQGNFSYLSDQNVVTLGGLL